MIKSSNHNIKKALILKNIIMTLFPLIFFLQNVAIADDKTPYGVYIGTGISFMQLNNNLSNESFSATGLMFQLGYKINPYIALEGRYSGDIGKIKYDHGNTNNPDYSDYPSNFSNIALYFKPMYSFYDFSLYALVGYGEVKLTNIPYSSKHSGADRAEDGFQWGTGFTYNINELLSIYIDYVNAYNGKGFDYRAQDAQIRSDLWTFGIAYMF